MPEFADLCFKRYKRFRETCEIFNEKVRPVPGDRRHLSPNVYLSVPWAAIVFVESVVQLDAAIRKHIKLLPQYIPNRTPERELLLSHLAPLCMLVVSFLFFFLPMQSSFVFFFSLVLAIFLFLFLLFVAARAV